MNDYGDKNIAVSQLFPSYELDSHVRVWRLTHNFPGSIHRFHHSSPISPSGNYLAVVQLPQEKRQPSPGETANIVLINISEGTGRCIAETRAWDVQLGAQLQWGDDDTTLFYNDMDVGQWEPYGVKHNIRTGDKLRLHSTVYSISPDGKLAVSSCLKRIARSQKGYGVVVPESSIKVDGRNEDDGIYVTCTKTGESRETITYREIIDQLPLEINQNGQFYGFHTQWNSSSDRFLLVLRFEPENGKRIKMLLTMKADGSDLSMAISPQQWAASGNHPTWCPDGEHLLMNLKLGDKLRFVTVRYDGSNLTPLTELSATRGHPSLSLNERYIITDASFKETVKSRSTRTPLLLVDLKTGEQKCVAEFETIKRDWFDNCFNKKQDLDPVMRIDLHPAMASRFTDTFVVNGLHEDRRHVFLLDLSSVMK